MKKHHKFMTLLWLAAHLLQQRFPTSPAFLTHAYPFPPPTSVAANPSLMHVARRQRNLTAAAAKPKRGSVVDSYQTVSVYCQKCGVRLFRYKKKNGTKSNLVKCFIERIVVPVEGGVPTDVADEVTRLQQEATRMSGGGNRGLIEDKDDLNHPSDAGGGGIRPPREFACPNCSSRYARSATIKGLPALKLAGGKVRMAKK